MAITYTTVDELKTYTQNNEIKELTNAQITALIEMAEVYIDAYAGYWEKYEPVDQIRRFPRSQDTDSSGATFIPDAINKATIAQAEFLYLKTPDSDHGIEEDDKPTALTISPRAKMLMKGYVLRGGRITINNNQNTNPDTGLFL